MATHNKSQLSQIGPEPYLVCDTCNSDNIIKNEFGYVCKDCGIMLNIQILKYHPPYNEDIVQYSPLGRTQIGTKKERLRNPQSYRFERLTKIDSVKTNEENAEIKASVEINRIFEALSLPNADKKRIFHNFKEIRTKILKGTKYRSPEKLIPIVLYFTYKYDGKSIHERALLAASKISKKDFQSFKMQIYKHMPRYKERNRKEYIINRIMEITEHFGLGMYFYYQSKKILHKLWNIIKNTKDDVVVGVVTSISALCLPETTITVSEICNRLNIRMSTIHKQVERKIFERLNILRFKSLVRSADLLKKVMEHLGIFFEQITEQKKELPEIVEIELDNASQVFNAHNTFDYYFYILRDLEQKTVVISVELNRNSVREIFEANNYTSKVNKQPVVKKDLLFNIGVWKGKGPPWSHNITCIS